MITEEHLFQQGNFRLHSGAQSWFKIECSSLIDEDWATIARLIAEGVKFSAVIGVPNGGLKLAKALQSYTSSETNLPTLIVDDVLTTGNSMEQVRKTVKGETLGIVLFARGRCPSWITPIFQMDARKYEQEANDIGYNAGLKRGRSELQEAVERAVKAERDRIWRGIAGLSPESWR